MIPRCHLRLLAGSLLLTACTNSDRASLTTMPISTQPAAQNSLPTESLPGKTSGSLSAIYRGDPNDITLADVAICLSALKRSGSNANAEDVVSGANALLSNARAITPVSLDPVPLDTQCDYTSPSRQLDFADIAVVFAALNLPRGDRTATQLASVASLFTFPQSLNATGIQTLPGDVIPGSPAVVNTLADENGTTPDNCSLREAIAAGNIDASFGGCPRHNGTITFAPGLTGTIQLTAGDDDVFSKSLFISNDATIIGPGAERLTVDANRRGRVFAINDGDIATEISVSISGLTITGGRLPNPRGRDTGGLPLGFDTSKGGGILTAENFTLSKSTVSGNSAYSSGGGVYVEGGTTTIVSSNINNNDAAYYFSGALGYEGGVSISSQGSVTISNSTISGNQSPSASGIRNLGSALISNSTISGNLPSYAGSGGVSEGVLNAGTLSLISTIVANNASVTYGGRRIDDLTNSGTVSASFSLIETGSVTNDEGNNIFGQDPRLDPTGLQDNGGLTRTIALQEGSPAIDAGSNPENLNSDQRGDGFERVVNGSADIGAFEVQ